MTGPQERKPIERSPNFPFISLESALARAEQFFEKEKRGTAPFPVAAKHWNYSPASSGALQTAAAMKSYGLMADEGSGAGRKLRLTEIALRIILDSRPDSQERERFKRQAALTPAIAAEIYANSPNAMLPSEATLNHHLVLDLGFNQSTAVRAVKIMQQNEEFTKSGASDFNSGSIESMETLALRPKSLNSGMPSELPNVRTPMTGPQEWAPASSNTERVKDDKNQDIIIQFVEAPTVEAYEFLKDYIDLRIKALKRGAVATKAESQANKEGEGVPAVVRKNAA